MKLKNFLIFTVFYKADLSSTVKADLSSAVKSEFYEIFLLTRKTYRYFYFLFFRVSFQVLGQRKMSCRVSSRRNFFRVPPKWHRTLFKGFVETNKSFLKIYIS